MKPRNKHEVRIQELTKRLPAINDEHIEYAKSKIKGTIIAQRNRLHCCECNHKWNNGLKNWQNELLTSATCPNCQKKNRVVTYSDPINTHHLLILDKVDDVQVLRYLLTTKYMSKENKPSYESNEVVQQWISKKGINTTYALNRNEFTYSWVFHSEMSIKKVDNQSSYWYNIYPENIFPKKRMLKVIRRNGFKSSFHRTLPSKFLESLITNPRTETLLKAKQYSLMMSSIKNDKSIETYWSSIKIAIRNGYIVKDASMYLDYLDFLSWFGKDLSSPKYICPADFKSQHDKMMIKKRAIRREQDIKKRKIEIEKANQIYIKNRKAFFDLEFKDKDITITVMKDVTQFLEESEILNHCIFDNGYYEKPNSLMLSAKVKDEVTESIEVDLRLLSIEQARGFNNIATKYNKRIVKLVKDNLTIIQNILAVA